MTPYRDNDAIALRASFGHEASRWIARNGPQIQSVSGSNARRFHAAAEENEHRTAVPRDESACRSARLSVTTCLSGNLSTIGGTS